MMKKAILLIMLLLFIDLVSAIGVSPSELSFEVFPGQNVSGNFRVFNKENKELAADIALRGELADYATIGQTHLDLTGKVFVGVPFTISIPLTIDAGEKKVVFLISEKQGEFAFIGATISLTLPVDVNIVSPEKEITAESSIVATEKDIVFQSMIKNVGQKDIEDLRAEVTIGDLSLKTKKTGLKSRIQTLLEAKKKNTLPPGAYTADITIRYDEKEKSFKETFRNLEPSLRVKELNVSAIKKGGISRIRLGLERDWNSDFEVSGTLKIEKEAEQMATLKIIPKTIGKKDSLEAYWDVDGFAEGKHTLLVDLDYENKTQHEEILLDLRTGLPTSFPSRTPAESYLLLMMVLAATLMAILMRRKK